MELVWNGDKQLAKMYLFIISFQYFNKCTFYMVRASRFNVF